MSKLCIIAESWIYPAWNGNFAISCEKIAFVICLSVQLERDYTFSFKGTEFVYSWFFQPNTSSNRRLPLLKSAKLLRIYTLVYLSRGLLYHEQVLKSTNNAVFYQHSTITWPYSLYKVVLLRIMLIIRQSWDI